MSDERGDGTLPSVDDRLHDHLPAHVFRKPWVAPKVIASAISSTAIAVRGAQEVGVTQSPRSSVPTPVS